MTRAAISGISPFFIVRDVPSSLAFYRDRLGFEITFQGPVPEDIFFGIVRRGGAQILLKALASLQCRTTRETSKKASLAGMHSLTSRILTRWPPSLRHATSNFPSR